SGQPAHGAAARAGIDTSDLKDAVRCKRIASIRRNDYGHPDAAVEGARQFVWSDVPTILQQLKDRGQGPQVGIYDRVAVFWQNSWKFFEKSAARDVRQALDSAFLNQRQKVADVNPGRF